MWIRTGDWGHSPDAGEEAEGVSNTELLKRVVELAAECRDDGMYGAEFVSTVAYGLGHVSQFSAPDKDAVMVV